MSTRSRFLPTILLILGFAWSGSLTVQAAEEKEAPDITPWEHLVVPGAADFEDPFAMLDSNELYLLAELASLRELRDTSTLTHQQNDTLASIEAKLTGQGVDIDGLMARRWEIAEMRRAAAVDPNPGIDGTDISLNGFAVPAPRLNDGRTLFYLSPEAGVFIDLPPPTQNQLVRVIFDGIPENLYLYQPLKVNGRIEIERTDQKMWIFGGEVSVVSAYTLVADSIEGVGFITHTNH
jgi:hypothetical protein